METEHPTSSIFVGDRSDEYWADTPENEQDAEEDYAELVDFDVSSQEVATRIEEVLSWFLQCIGEGQLPVLTLISRTAKNTVMVPGDTSEANAGNGMYAMRTRNATTEVSLTDRKGDQAFRYVRVFKILQVAYELTKTQRTITQRELYYRLVNPPIVSTPAHVNEAIQDAVALLHVPRISLGICCSSRGAVAGTLSIYDPAADAVTDCSTVGQAGFSLPGNTSLVQQYQLDVRQSHCVLVVEKDAIFQRLAGERIFETMPMLLVTAKGMPDMATRAFLHSVHAVCPDLPVLALVDWNPSGVSIALTYKYGSSRMGLESPKHAVPALRWLGVRSSQLAGAEMEVMQPLQARDASLIETLSAAFGQSDPLWVNELQEMKRMGCKAEIEALYNVTGGADGLVDSIINAIEDQDFL